MQDFVSSRIRVYLVYFFYMFSPIPGDCPGLPFSLAINRTPPPPLYSSLSWWPSSLLGVKALKQKPWWREATCIVSLKLIKYSFGDVVAFVV